jgi:hypothetical protein
VLFEKAGSIEDKSSFEIWESVTCVTLQGYLTFKRSEVWIELREELDAEGIEPTEVC